MLTSAFGLGFDPISLPRWGPGFGLGFDHTLRTESDDENTATTNTPYYGVVNMVIVARMEYFVASPSYQRNVARF